MQTTAGYLTRPQRKGTQLSGGSLEQKIDLKHAHLNLSFTRSCHLSVQMSGLYLVGKLFKVRRSIVHSSFWSHSCPHFLRDSVMARSLLRRYSPSTSMTFLLIPAFLSWDSIPSSGAVGNVFASHFLSINSGVSARRMPSRAITPRDDGIGIHESISETSTAR